MSIKNVMVANLQKNRRYSQEKLIQLLEAQIENSLALGWCHQDIIIITNFDYEHMGIKAHNFDLYDGCLTGSKVFAVLELFKRNMADDILWAHDLDAWQNVEFVIPDFKDVGIATYSNPKFNGGVVFYRPSAIDIVQKIAETIIKDKETREEPTLNRVLKSDEYKNRVTVINQTFNVGCSGFVKRYQRSIKPIVISHFHPLNRIAWDTHVQDRNKLGVISTSPRLIKLLESRFYRDKQPGQENKEIGLLRPVTSGDK